MKLWDRMLETLVEIYPAAAEAARREVEMAGLLTHRR